MCEQEHIAGEQRSSTTTQVQVVKFRLHPPNLLDQCRVIAIADPFPHRTIRIKPDVIGSDTCTFRCIFKREEFDLSDLAAILNINGRSKPLHTALEHRAMVSGKVGFLLKDASASE